MNTNPIPATASPFIFDVTQATFEAEVLEASRQQPVLVDFWATWCGPCRALGPLLEKLVAEYNGAVRLAKVDCDKEQMLAGMFGIRSIPTVMLVRDGQIADGFQGALPESALREFLARHVQPGAAPTEEAFAEEAEDYLAETPEQTIARLQQAIAKQPDNAELKLELALTLMRSGNTAAAEAELDALPANLATDDRAKRLRGQLDFARALNGAPSRAELESRLARNPDDHAARDLLGVRLLVEGEAEAGLQQFLDILRAQRDWNDGQAKKRMIAAFDVLDDAELVSTYRRKMASLLF